MSTISRQKEYLLWFLVFGIPIIFGLLPLDMAPKMQYFLAIALWGGPGLDDLYCSRRSGRGGSAVLVFLFRGGAG